METSSKRAAAEAASGAWLRALEQQPFPAPVLAPGLSRGVFGAWQYPGAAVCCLAWQVVLPAGCHSASLAPISRTNESSSFIADASSLLEGEEPGSNGVSHAALGEQQDADSHEADESLDQDSYSTPGPPGYTEQRGSASAQQQPSLVRVKGCCLAHLALLRREGYSLPQGLSLPTA